MRLVSQFMVLKSLIKSVQGSELSELFTDTMGKLFQSLYNKYSRRNEYSDVYSKVFLSWGFDCGADLLNLKASVDFSVIMNLEQRQCVSLVCLTLTYFTFLS